MFFSQLVLVFSLVPVNYSERVKISTQLFGFYYRLLYLSALCLCCLSFLFFFTCECLLVHGKEVNFFSTLIFYMWYKQPWSAESGEGIDLHGCIFFDKNTDICQLLHHKRRLVWPLQSKIQSTHFFQSFGVEEVRERSIYLFIYFAKHDVSEL